MSRTHPRHAQDYKLNKKKILILNEEFINLLPMVSCCKLISLLNLNIDISVLAEFIAS